jgi:transposase
MSIPTNHKAKYYAGIDLHKKYSYMTIVDHQGYIQYQGRHNHTNNSLIPTLLQYNTNNSNVEATLESSYGWYWLADELDEAYIPFKLAHPKKVNAIAGKKKTDKVDSKILADLLRMNMLPQSYIPTKKERSLKELLRFRLALVRQQSTIKRRLRDILAKQNLHCPYTNILGNKAKEWLTSKDYPFPYGQEINSLLTISSTLEEQIEIFSSQVTAQAKKDPKACLLESIPGIGKILALTLSTEIGDIHRFPNGRALASYAGVVPSVKSSGDKTYYGGTSKHGNPYIRWALAEALPHIVKKDPEISSFYERIKNKKGTGKARVAIMNKMIRIIFALLTKERRYCIKQVSNKAID